VTCAWLGGSCAGVGGGRGAAVACGVVGWVAGRVEVVAVLGFVAGAGVAWAARDNAETVRAATARRRIGAERCI
jgi:hypothetical protein